MQASISAVVVLLAACSWGSENPERPFPEAPRPPPNRAPPPERVTESPTAVLKLAGTISYEGPATGRAVFVAVRDPARPGPPLAVKKLPPGPFPLTFSVTGADRMPMGAADPVPGQVSVTVRLDADGDASSKAPGEPSITLETAASSTDLVVTLE